jgi:hypothetical protein
MIEMLVKIYIFWNFLQIPTVLKIHPIQTV